MLTQEGPDAPLDPWRAMFVGGQIVNPYTVVNNVVGANTAVGVNQAFQHWVQVQRDGPRGNNGGGF